MSRLIKNAAVITFIFSLLMAFNSFAGVVVSNQDVATTSKTVTWTADDPNAEMRWAAGSLSSGDFDTATPAGNGSASVQIEENGNYTFFSKSGEAIAADVVSITNIDRTSPDITVTNLVVNTNGTMDVYYSASDYFSSCDTRYKKGQCSASDWGSATPMSGGVISNLPNGTYTLFAKDSAGNVGTYLLQTDSQSKEGETANSTEWEKSTNRENIYSGATADITYGDNKPNIAILIAKCDSETGKQVPGAKLQLKNAATGEVIEEWTTSDCDRVFYGMENNTKYVLTELYAPNGYYKASPIEFYPKNLDNYTLIMYDKPMTTIEKTPSGGDTPKPEEPKTPTKLPQTGGFDDYAKFIALGFFLLIAGGSGTFLLRKKEKK